MRPALASRIASTSLYLAAFGCLIFAIGDVHASPLRATLAIAAGGVLWITGEALS